MDGILPKLRWIDKQRLIERMRRCREARLKEHYLIIVNLIHGRSPAATAAALSINKSTVCRVAARFHEQGEVGLLDRREGNGEMKLDEYYLSELYEVVRGHPEDYGWKRPTWTREMLVETLRERTGIGIHVGTMSRALKMIRARRGRPRAGRRARLGQVPRPLHAGPARGPRAERGRLAPSARPGRVRPRHCRPRRVPGGGGARVTRCHWLGSGAVPRRKDSCPDGV